MEDVKWLEVTLDTTEAELDALCARLTGNGVTGLAIEDEEDFKTFLEQNHQYWDYVDDGLLARMKGVCRVKFYITDDADGRKQLEGWLAGIDQPYSLASLGDNDWAHSWQKYYKPMPVGERLYIVPEWERGEPSRRGKRPCTSIPASPSAPGATPPPSSASWGWSGTPSPESRCWIWAAAAVSSPSPPWSWGLPRRRQWILIPRRWTWPTRMPPSTASGGTAIPCGRAMSSPTGPWWPSWPGRSTPWCWPTSWPT